MVNPLIRIERDAWALALRMAIEFGLTPSGRARLGLTTVLGRSIAQEMESRVGVRREAIPEVIEVEVEDEVP